MVGKVLRWTLACEVAAPATVAGIAEAYATLGLVMDSYARDLARELGVGVSVGYGQEPRIVGRRKAAEPPAGLFGAGCVAQPEHVEAERQRTVEMRALVDEAVVAEGGGEDVRLVPRHEPGLSELRPISAADLLALRGDHATDAGLAEPVKRERAARGDAEPDTDLTIPAALVRR